MPAFRAASLREAPSKIDASAKSRRDWFASRTRRALWRNSSADQSVRVILMAIRSPKANQPLHRITAATSWEPSAEESENLTLGITCQSRRLFPGATKLAPRLPQARKAANWCALSGKRRLKSGKKLGLFRKAPLGKHVSISLECLD